MADITISMSAANITRVKDAFASAYDYDTNKIGAETKNAFAKRMLIRYVKEVVKHQERLAQEAIDTAAQEAGYTDPDVT